jgi:hypothetical protein
MRSEVVVLIVALVLVLIGTYGLVFPEAPPRRTAGIVIARYTAVVGVVVVLFAIVHWVLC